MGNFFFSDATESMQLLKECFLNDPLPNIYFCVDWKSKMAAITDQI